MLRCEQSDQNLARDSAGDLARCTAPGVNVFGPVPAVIEKLRGRFRFQVLATSKTARSLQGWLDAVTPQRAHWIKRGVRVAIDVDPAELL